MSPGSQAKVPERKRREGGREKPGPALGGLGADAGPGAVLAVSEALGTARAAVLLGLGVPTSFC